MASRDVDIRQIAAKIRQKAIDCPRIFVGIDGPGGSGKTTLATQLVAAIKGACLVPVDDFYLPSSRRQERCGELGSLFDLPRLTEQVILPGAKGDAFGYQRYDWVQDELAEWVEVPRGRPVIVEGVFCLAAALRDAYTYRIWCHADPMLRLARGLARDGEGSRSLWTDVWMPQEDAYAMEQHPECNADLLVESSPIGADTHSFRFFK